MDLDRIKKIYDERFNGDPSAMEAYVVERLLQGLMDEVLHPRQARKDVFSRGGTKVIVEKDDEGRIIDMRFEVD